MKRRQRSAAGARLLARLGRNSPLGREVQHLSPPAVASPNASQEEAACRLILASIAQAVCERTGVHRHDGSGPSLVDARLAEETSAWLDEFARGELFDPFRLLHEDWLRAEWRRRGGEFYTPDWLADRVVELAWRENLTWLDPTAGGGAFVFALARRAARGSSPFPRFVAFERDPASLLMARASFGMAQHWLDPTRSTPLVADARQVDVVLDAADTLPSLSVDRIVGNPPWILWDQIDAETRARSANAWEEYGLRTEKGMRGILGGGKRDLSFLVLPLAVDRWLRNGGELSMVVPRSVFQSTSSGRGLRRWRLPDGTPLRILSVDDLSKLQPFAGASVQTAIVHLRRGEETAYPVPYSRWTAEDPAHIEPGWARPSDPEDVASSWSISANRADELEPMEGAMAYRACLGVNTGGANGVYWLQLLERSAAQWHMENLADRGKRDVERVEAWLEPDFLYPALLGKDVRPWKAVPSAWLLMVQDPARRRGWDEADLSARGPRTLAYLRHFESVLRERAALRRYFRAPAADGAMRETGTFYSMFNVGPTTLAPIKVVWNRMGAKLSAAVVGEVDGRPILPQETHAFIAVDSWEEGDYLAALLNSRWVQDRLARQSAGASKSFATPRVIHRIRISRFDPNDARHRALSEWGRKGRLSGILTLEEARRLDAEGARYWDLPAADEI